MNNLSKESTWEGSTNQLVNFSFWYFLFYVGTTVATKFFTSDKQELHFLFNSHGDPMPGMTYLYPSTAGGVLVCLVVVWACRWFKEFKSNGSISVGPFTFPREYLWLIPSGICTALIIPATQFMYTLPITVMVAMTLMRALIIVIGRGVDAIQIHLGYLRKKVSWEENVAAVFAIATVVSVIYFTRRNFILEGKDPSKTFDFLTSMPALITMILYVTAYALRIYIMNHYKNTVGPPTVKGFFAVEQAFAAITVVIAATFFIASPQLFGWKHNSILQVVDGFKRPEIWAVIGGMAFGGAAFFSVFLLMFKGRTGTFSVVINRLTSLIAGTAASLIIWKFFKGKLPGIGEWYSLALILVAIGFLVKAEMKYKKAKA